jgi:hypothetical protein
MTVATPMSPLVLDDGATTFTASGYGQASGAPAVVKLGALTAWNGAAVINAVAIKTTAGDETYQLNVQGSVDGTFASPITLGSLQVATTGQGFIPFPAYFGGVFYPYLRLQLVLGGTAPSIQMQALSGPVGGCFALPFSGFSTASLADLTTLFGIAAQNMQQEATSLIAWAAGSASGGPNGDGAYPVYDAGGNSYSLQSFAAMAAELSDELTTAFAADDDANGIAAIAAVIAAQYERGTRIDENTSLGASVSTLSSSVATYQTATQTSLAAQAAQLTTLTATVDDNEAAFTSFQQATATSLGAQAASITTLTASLGSANATLADFQSAQASTNTATATSVSTLSATVGTVSSSLTAFQGAQATTNSATATSISTLSSSIGGVSSSLSSFQSAQNTTNSATATSISTLTSTVNGVSATVSEQAGTLVTLGGKTQAWLDFAVGSATATLTSDGESSNITLAANAIALANTIGGAILTALTIVGGVVNIATKLLLGSSMVLDPTSGTIYASLGSVALALGGPFGASGNLVFWFGPVMALGAMTKSNGTIWFDTIGDAYFGGSLSAGTLTNQNGTSDTSASATVETNEFGSNGGAITVTLSYSYSGQVSGAYSSLSAFNTAKAADPNNPTSQGASSGVWQANGTDGPYQVQLLRGVNGATPTLVATLNVNGTWSDTWTNAGDSWSALQQSSAGGSLTYTDPDKSTENRQYQATLVSRNPEYGGSISQRINILCVEQP